MELEELLKELQDANMITFSKHDDSCRHEPRNEYYQIHINKKFKQTHEAQATLKLLKQILDYANSWHMHGKWLDETGARMLCQKIDEQQREIKQQRKIIQEVTQLCNEADGNMQDITPEELKKALSHIELE